MRRWEGNNLCSSKRTDEHIAYNPKTVVEVSEKSEARCRPAMTGFASIWRKSAVDVDDDLVFQTVEVNFFRSISSDI